jgi:N-methylhydantoinase A
MSAPTRGRAILAADIGGTFTDLVLRLPDGSLLARKVLSTPDDYSRAITEGLEGMFSSRAGTSAADVAEVCHGTTVGTNAVLERKGALTALVTTRGFRDVLEIRRLRFPEPYQVQWEKPAPLVPRHLRLELDERVDADGSVLTAPPESEVDELAAHLGEAGVESVAVALLNSHANPAHENWLAERLSERLPGVSITASAELLPEMGEYERTSTAVTNAYLAPTMERYLKQLRSRLDGMGQSGPLYVAQSNGGLFLHTFAMRRPYLTLESGPAGGCVAAQHLARRTGYQQVLAVDMGGTTTKASFIADGQVTWASEFEIGSHMSQASRLMNGGGYAVRCPLIDLAEVGAGGGSIAWVDEAGLLHVGPRSAGAVPGPACYGQSGAEATLTDANVVLGYLNPVALAGGDFPIDSALAREAVARLADRLSKGVMETAYGIHLIANSNMTSAIRAVSTQRGRDVREVDMLAFGGSGPVQAVGLAASLGLRRVLIPPLPGLFSSVGLLVANVEHHLMRGFVAPLPEVDLDRLNATLAAMEMEVSTELRALGAGAEASIERMAALKLAQRSGEVLLTIPSGLLTGADLADLGRRFEESYRATYRHLPRDAGAELLNVRVVGRVEREADPDLVLEAAGEASQAREGSRRQAFFGSDAGSIEVDVVGRETLRAGPRNGPLVVEEADSTTVVHPGWRARLDEHFNLLVER